MALASISARLAPLARAAIRVAGFLAPLATRLTLAQVFIVAGLGKLRNIDQPTAFFTQLGIPFPLANAWLVAVVEFVGGICLLLGLGTRIAAGLLLATMGVALATAHRDELIAALVPQGDLSAISPWMLALLLLWLAAVGAGPLSGDRLLGRLPTKSGPAADQASAP